MFRGLHFVFIVKSFVANRFGQDVGLSYSHLGAFIEARTKIESRWSRSRHHIADQRIGFADSSRFRRIARENGRADVETGVRWIDEFAARWDPDLSSLLAELIAEGDPLAFYFFDVISFFFLLFVLVEIFLNQTCNLLSFSATDDINSNGSNILVSTPGRLNDLLQKKDCSLSATVKALEVLILDEADRLLSMGFESTLNQIFMYLPKQRRTGLFSATQVLRGKYFVMSHSHKIE